MLTRTRLVRRAVVLTAVGAGLLVGGTSVAGGASAPSKFQVTVGDDFSSGSIRFVTNMPSSFTAGTYKFGLANNSIGPHVLIALSGLSESMTVAQFRALLDQGPPPPAGILEVGAVFSKPGQDHQKLFDLNTTGRYGFFCPITTPAGVPHYELGFIGFFNVAAG